MSLFSGETRGCRGRVEVYVCPEVHFFLKMDEHTGTGVAPGRTDPRLT